MGEVLTIFKNSTGLNNVEHPAELDFDGSGNSELSYAININISQKGKVFRRSGYSLLLSGDYHSLFTVNNEYALVVYQDCLKILYPDLTLSASIAVVTRNCLVRYENIGGIIYWLNGHEKGFVKDKINFPWVASDYVGPTTNRNYASPPIGHLLTYFNGRVYIAETNIIWHSQPFAYSWFNKAANFIWTSTDIRMLRAVQNGIFYANDYGVYFLRGTGPGFSGFFNTFICDEKVVEGSDVYVDGREISADMNQKIIIFTTNKGICLGMPDGSIRNVTRDKVVYDESRYGSGYIIDGNYYCTMK